MNCCEKCEGLDRGSGYDGYQPICENPACPCHSNSRGKGGIGTINEDVLGTVGGVGVLPSQEKHYDQIDLKITTEGNGAYVGRQEKWTSTACSSPEHRLLGCRTLYYKGSLFDCYEKLRASRQPSKAWEGVAFFLAKEYAKMYYLVSEESWPAHKESDALKNLISFIRQKIAEAGEEILQNMRREERFKAGRTAALKECLEVIERMVDRRTYDDVTDSAHIFASNMLLNKVKQQITSLLK